LEISLTSIPMEGNFLVNISLKIVTHFNLEFFLVNYCLKFSSKIGIKQPKRMRINISFNVNLVTLGPMRKC
jgi:hypothetical protein